MKRTPEELQKKIKEYEVNRLKVDMRQARLALLDYGILDQVETAISNLDEPAKTKAQIEWEYSPTVRRNANWVIELGSELGLTEDEIDDLFLLAKTLG